MLYQAELRSLPYCPVIFVLSRRIASAKMTKIKGRTKEGAPLAVLRGVYAHAGTKRVNVVRDMDDVQAGD